MSAPRGPQRLRLFTALWPDAVTLARLAAQRDAWDWPRGARPVSAPLLHITLHFLGAVPAERLDEIDASLRPVPVGAFEMRLDTHELWRGGLAVLRASEVAPSLAALHGAVGEALQAIGFSGEARPFVPHVTLARHARAAGVPSGLPPLQWAGCEFTLVESAPSVDRYRVLRRYGRRE